MTKNDSETAAPPWTIQSIIVKQSAYDNDDPGHIVDQVGLFLHHMLDKGFYERGELPVNAFYCDRVMYYFFQVVNGGHGQFVHNSGWQADIIDDIRDGLMAMNAEPYIKIFSDLCQLIESDTERADVIAEAGGFGKPDPGIEALDNRFLDADPGCATFDLILKINARWLHSLPEIVPTADNEYQERLRALCLANPRASERSAERRRGIMQDRLVDPLRVATHLLCTAANCLPVRTIGTGRPGATAPDGRTTVGWRIRSRYGHQIVYMLDDVAFLCDIYLSDGRKLTHELSKELGGLVRARDPNASKLLSSELEKEAARVPASDAIEAIEMAKQLPVVTAAELFHQKLDDTGAIVNLFAARKAASGDWIWALKTEKSLFPFTFTGEEWVMFDHALKPMTKLPKTDVESAAT